MAWVERQKELSDETSAFPFYTIPRFSSTVKPSYILWNHTGRQQGLRLAALAVPSPRSLNDGTAGPFLLVFGPVRQHGPTWHDAWLRLFYLKVLEGGLIWEDHCHTRIYCPPRYARHVVWTNTVIVNDSRQSMSESLSRCAQVVRDQVNMSYRYFRYV